MSFSKHILQFITDLQFPIILPKDIEVMHPFKNEEVMKVCEKFYHKFYNDDHKRNLIIGINPGRFGGGVTGIPFTDPIRLQNDCGIENNWPKKQELSSLFIYDMIKAFGGPQQFYRRFYFTAVSPLGFTKNNKNLNYYDDKELQKNINPFVIDCLKRQLNFGVVSKVAFCLGDGKNFRYLTMINDEIEIFDVIIPLAHPRFIMQYRLKKKEEYIKFYLQQFHRYI